MEVTITKAAKMAGVSRATIYNDIDSGKLSAVRGAKNRKMIDVGELQRVYKNLNTPDEKNHSLSAQNGQIRHDAAKSVSKDQIAVLQERLESERRQREHIEELLDKEKEERRRERDAAKTFEEYSKSVIESQKASIDNFTHLLEDQRSESSKEGQWKDRFKTLEERVANQAKQNKMLKRALEAERAKPKTLFERLFG